MGSFEQQRRSFLLTLGALGISPLPAQAILAGQAGAGAGYVLGPGEGEHLIHFRDGGRRHHQARYRHGVPRSRRGNPAGDARHRYSDSPPFQDGRGVHVLDGSGAVLLDDVRHSFEKVERFSSPGTPGTASRIRTTNSFSSGSCRRLGWMVSSATRAARPASPRNVSPRSRSARSHGSTTRNSGSGRSRRCFSRAGRETMRPDLALQPTARAVCSRRALGAPRLSAGEGRQAAECRF